MTKTSEHIQLKFHHVEFRTESCLKFLSVQPLRNQIDALSAEESSTTIKKLLSFTEADHHQIYRKHAPILSNF